MGKWNIKNLGTICQLAYGKNLATALFTAEGYKVFGANSIIGLYPKYTHEEAEVLVSSRGEYSGVINFSEPKSYITNNSIVCKLKLDIDKLFLFYALKNIPRQTFVSGSAQPQVVIQDLEKVKVYYPEDKHEQTKIASILSISDKAISQTEKLIAKYQRIKTGLMQDLLNKGIDVLGNIRNEKTHRFKTENGLRVPEEWNADFTRNYMSLNYGKSQKLVVSEEGVYPIYGTSGIMAYASQPLFDNPSVLIGRKGTLNNPQYLENPFWCVDTAYYVSEFKNGNMKWLYYYLTMLDLNSLSEATGVPSLLRETFYSLIFPFPKKEEQDQIVKIIDKIVSDLNSLINNLYKLKSLKIGLMQDLLSGKVRVKIKEESFF